MANLRRFFSKFFNETKYMLILSAVVAVVVWFYAVGVYSPESTKTLDGVTLSVDINKTIEQQENLMILKGVPKTVVVEVDGNRVDLATLYAGDVSASIDLAGITEPGEYSRPVSVRLPLGNYSVAEVIPSQVKVKIARSKTVGVTVATNASTSIQGKIKEGYAVESVKPSPSIIKVTGPESIVDNIKDAVIDPVDVTDKTDNVVKMVNFTLRDKNGEAIDMTDITTDVSQTTVTVTLYTSKRVPLTASVINTSGGLESSFANVSITPSEIDILGGQSVISGINSIDLGTIDMADASKEGKTVEMDIILPNGTKGLGLTNTKATVRVTYPELATKTFNISSFALSQQSNKTITVRPIKVTVRGIPDDISRLTEADIKAVVAIDDVNTTGQIQLPVTFEFPADMKVSVQGTYQASVTIK